MPFMRKRKIPQLTAPPIVTPTVKNEAAAFRKAFGSDSGNIILTTIREKPIFSGMEHNDDAKGRKTKNE